MTQRQLKLIDERCFNLNKINEAFEQDPERAQGILDKYRIEHVYQSLPEIMRYMPDSVLETIVAEMIGDDGK